MLSMHNICDVACMTASFHPMADETFTTAPSIKGGNEVGILGFNRNTSDFTLMNTITTRWATLYLRGSSKISFCGHHNTHISCVATPAFDKSPYYVFFGQLHLLL